MRYFSVAQVDSFLYIYPAWKNTHIQIIPGMQIKDLLTEKRLRHLEEMVSEITVDELKSKLKRNEIFKLVEISNPDDFESGHIKDAINIQLDDLEDEAGKRFRKFQQIVIYVQDAASSVGTVATVRLQRLGFSNAVLLRGGKEAWRNAGLPLTGQEDPEQETEANEESDQTWLK